MEGAAAGGGATPSQQLVAKWGRIYQTYLDKTTIFPQYRWAVFVISLFIYCARVYMLNGFFIVTYGLGIFLLNLLIGFLSPAIDPDEDMGDGEFQLPTAGDEYRPFSRKLPEFKAWVSAIKAVLISIFLTFFEFCDLPVFWPILLMYFVLLFFLTMKERVKHMIKYKYVPVSWGKQTYADLTKIQPPGGAGGGGAGFKDNK